FEKMKENNLVLEKRLTELSDMVRLGEESEEKQMSKYLQDIHDKIDEFSKYQQWVTEKVNEKLRIIGCDIETIKKYFENVSNTIFDDLEKNLISIKSNSEKSFSKYEALETWIQTLEKDVTKNNLSIIALDHSYQALELARSQNSGSASIFSPDYSQPGAFVAAPSTVTYDKSPVPKPPGPYFVPPTPFCPPPPPPPPPPPAPKVSNADKSSSQKVYHRIPITTEVLKSVVLKSPGERKLKGCVLSPK
ncbi:formin-like protein 3, partial [Melanaphis sacchari]|uniref:formin-like protein 3 n=1 Tax=Melanaphis sacchari TaxID=742174 RepID=UPI000DC133CD